MKYIFLNFQIPITTFQFMKLLNKKSQKPSIGIWDLTFGIWLFNAN